MNASKPRRWLGGRPGRFRFSLRAVFVVMTVLGAAAGIWRIIPRPIDHELAFKQVKDGLSSKAIIANQSASKFLQTYSPESATRYGPFVRYHFTWLSGYHGLTIIAKQGVLCRASEWSCTFTQVYFDVMTESDEAWLHRLIDEANNAEGDGLASS